MLPYRQTVEHVEKRVQCKHMSTFNWNEKLVEVFPPLNTLPHPNAFQLSRRQTIAIWYDCAGLSIIIHIYISLTYCSFGQRITLFIYIFPHVAFCILHFPHFRWQLNCKLTRKLQKCKLKTENWKLCPCSLHTAIFGWPNSLCLKGKAQPGQEAGQGRAGGMAWMHLCKEPEGG